MTVLRSLVTAVLFLAFATPAAAQVLFPSDPATITANAGEVCWGLDKSIPSVMIRVAGTWTGTIAPRVRLDLTATNHTPPTGSVSDTSITSNTNVTVYNLGFQRVCMVATAWTSGTATFSTVAGGGGTSGSGSSFNGVLLDAAAGDAVTDTANNAIRVNIIAGAGSGGTAAVDNSAFTFGTTNLTPAGHVFDDTTPNAATEDRVAAPRMSANRVPYAILRDAAGNERGAIVTAANELLVELGAGAASIGTLGANSGVDIGDVTLTAGAASIGTLGANSGVDIGDVTINNAAGAAAVNIQDGGNSITIDGAVSCSNCTGSGASAVDDAAFTIATASVAPAGFLADQTTPDSVDEGDVGLARMTLARVQLNTLWDAAGNERGANVTANNELLVELGAGAAAIGSVVLGTTDADDATIASGQTNSNVNGLMQWFDGTNWKRFTFGVAGTPSTQVTTIQGITAGTPVPVNGTVTVNAGTGFTSDATADSAALTTGPQNMALGKNTTLPTAVTDGDAVRLLADLRGRLTPKNVCQDPDLVQSVVISTATSGNVQLVALSGTTTVTACGFNVMAGGTVGVQFIAGTGTACATGETDKTGVYPLIVNGGLNTGFGAKVFAGAAGEAVCVELSAAIQIDGILTYVQQ